MMKPMTGWCSRPSFHRRGVWLVAIRLNLCALRCCCYIYVQLIARRSEYEGLTGTKLCSSLSNRSYLTMVYLPNQPYSLSSTGRTPYPVNWHIILNMTTKDKNRPKWNCINSVCTSALDMLALVNLHECGLTVWDGDVKASSKAQL